MPLSNGPRRFSANGASLEEAGLCLYSPPSHLRSLRRGYMLGCHPGAGGWTRLLDRPRVCCICHISVRWPRSAHIWTRRMASGTSWWYHERVLLLLYPFLQAHQPHHLVIVAHLYSGVGVGVARYGYACVFLHPLCSSSRDDDPLHFTHPQKVQCHVRFVLHWFTKRRLDRPVLHLCSSIQLWRRC